VSEIRRIKTGEIDAGLTLLFRDVPCGGPQTAIDEDAFRALARRERYDLSRQIVISKDGELLFCCFFVPNAGGTAFIFISTPVYLDDADRKGAVGALVELRRWAADEGCTLFQVLLEVDDAARQEICLRSGFCFLTDLIYMYRFTEDGFVQPDGEGVSWQEYSEQRHDLFKKVIAQTYAGSSDCPELEGLRDMEETIAAHKAAGHFDARCWQLLFYGDEPAGAFLLSRLPSGDTVELSYMGLVPSRRGCGFSKVLLGRALECALNEKARIVTLAVDSRNSAARGLYERYGFKEIFQRRVMYNSTRWKDGIG
jgi:GNAT superfamily N-acetyltransferase